MMLYWQIEISFVFPPARDAVIEGDKQRASWSRLAFAVACESDEHLFAWGKGREAEIDMEHLVHQFGFVLVQRLERAKVKVMGRGVTVNSAQGEAWNRDTRWVRNRVGDRERCGTLCGASCLC